MSEHASTCEKSSGGWLCTCGSFPVAAPSPTLEWEYSRNQRRHTAYDAAGEERFRIRSAAPYKAVQGKHGYQLFDANDAPIQSARRVALLKAAAANISKTNDT